MEPTMSERMHIGFFGMRNVGKSSVVNAITGQNLSIVSDVKGTTTDPVKKAMELLPLGPVVIIDTPGLDDEGELGKLRIEKTKRVLGIINIAILVVDATIGKKEKDEELIKLFEEKEIPYIIAYNKSDLFGGDITCGENEIYVSAKTKENIYELKEKIAKQTKQVTVEKKIITDLLEEGDTVVLVIPIDESAPKGRLILPQQLVMREILDAHCNFVVCQDTELQETLAILNKKPKVVVTDSQVFEKVQKIVPNQIYLTSFSILFARYKGNIKQLLNGAKALEKLKEDSKILISEGCTHHRQCNDIGTVKLPKWIEKYTGVKPKFEFTSGQEFAENLEQYDLIIHCGGCMINEKEMQYRLKKAKEANISIVNYGLAIAKMHGILERSIEILKDKE